MRFHTESSKLRIYTLSTITISVYGSAEETTTFMCKALIENGLFPNAHNLSRAYNNLEDDSLGECLDGGGGVYHVLQGRHPLADFLMGSRGEGDRGLASVHSEGVVARLRDL